VSESKKFKNPISTGISRGPQWYAVQTKPRQEQCARENLERQGFEVYLPQIARLKRRNGNLVSRITAFFPRYLFTRFDANADNWAPIRSSRGVSSLVRIAGRPLPIPEGLVESLKANENSEQLQQLEPKSWQSGDEVEIEQGPFAGYRCIFREARGAGRVAVLLSLIGKPTLVTLSKQDLQIPQYA